MARINVWLVIGLLAIGCSVNPAGDPPTPTPVATTPAAAVASPETASPLTAGPTPVATPTVTPAPATATPSTVGPTPIATPTVTRAPAATATPTPRPTKAATRTPSPGPACPPSSVLTVRQFIDSDPACLGGSDVAIRAWADTPFATGWEAPHIEPAWLAYPPDGISMLWGVPPTGEAHVCSQDADRECASIFVYLRRKSGISLGDQPRWVIVTGHIDDPASDTCHYVVGPDWPGDPPDDTTARTECRGHFVLTGVAAAPD